MLSRTNIFLTVLLATIGWLLVTSRVDYARPNIEILPDMKYTPAATAYAENAVFANGRTLQPPVSGTIARGDVPLHFDATPVDAERAGQELRNPFQVTSKISEGDPDEALAQSIQRGSANYRVFCITCHGATGLGDGPVPQRGFPPPPSLLTGKSTQMKDGQLFHLLTYGQGSMHGFAAQLTPHERWDLVNYVRHLQPQQRPEEPNDSEESNNNAQR